MNSEYQTPNQTLNNGFFFLLTTVLIYLFILKYASRSLWIR